MGSSTSSTQTSSKRSSETLSESGTILILGAASTGKSTFLRQAQALKRSTTRGPLDPDGMNLQDKQQYAVDMRWNAVNGMRNILASSEHLREFREILSAAMSSPSLPRIAEEAQIVILQTVYQLWKNPIVREAVENQNYSGLLCVLATGVEERLLALLPDMVNEKWLPTAAETALARSPTQGKWIERLDLGDEKERKLLWTCDMGGARKDRPKYWNRCYERTDYAAVLFFFAPGAVGEMLAEDPSTPKLEEDFSLWLKVSKVPAFQQTKMFVILNKMDRFPFSSAHYFSLTQFQREWDTLPLSLLSLIRDYAVVGDSLLRRLEFCFQGTFMPQETPIEYIRRSILALRPNTVIIECDATNVLSMRAAIGVLEHHLLC